MKILRSLVGVALAAAFAATLPAQQTQSGYHTVACFKVKPENAADFRKFLTDESHKVAQGRVDNGEITTWYLLRSVYPQGAIAECDYLIIAMFPGAPQLLGPENLGAALKKEGMTISADDYVNRRNSLSRLVSVAVFQNRIAVGSPKKGAFFRVNYMKVPDIQEWLAYEKKVWQPFAEAMVKDGVISGWSLNTRVLPGGSDLPFQAVTVDAFPSYDAVFAADPQFPDRFRKVHPDMELGTTFEQFEKLRTIQSTQLFELADVVTAAK
jgi:hypothetical protein